MKGVISMTPVHSHLKRDTLNVRIKPDDRELIQRAAQTSGKTITAFLMDAVRQMALDTLLDQRLFRVTPEVYEAFLCRLDAPSSSNKKLERLAHTPLPWNK